MARIDLARTFSCCIHVLLRLFDLRFVGVTEENIYSILRRTAACRYKAFFVDGARIAGKEAQAAARGIFPRDPTLKDFLRDRPACLVTLRCIWNYARRRTASETRAVLENYVVHGGDEGLTRIAVRTSCNLPVEAEQSVDILEEALAAIDDASNPPPQQVDELERTKKAETLEQMKVMADIKRWLQSERKDWFTAAQIKTAKAGSSFSFGRSESAAVLEKLAANGYLLSENRELPKAGKSTIYLPRISTKKALDAIVPLRPDEHLTCVEEYKWYAMRSRMSPESSRTLNLGTLTKAYRTKENTTRKRGAPSKKRGTEQEELDELAEDLAAVAARESAFFLEILKLVENSETTDAGLVPVQRQYFYPVEGRCRRYLQENGAQNCSRLARAISCPETRDFDLHASMFTIVVQLAEKVQPENLDISAWRKVAADRKKVCTNTLQCTEHEGKQILMEVANGASVSKFKDLQRNAIAFLDKLSTESRELRWLACSQLPDFYKQKNNQKKPGWPEATTFSLWWTVAEDFILEHLLDAVRVVDVPGHVSCHFDGVLLSTSLVEAVEEKVGKNLLQYMEAKVLQDTGFQIRLKEKTLHSFHDILGRALKPFEDKDPFDTHMDLLTVAPNSIPAGLIFLGADVAHIIRRLQAESPVNIEAEQLKVRRYVDWHGVDENFLLPIGKLAQEQSHNCLVHLELPEESYSVAVKVMSHNNIIVLSRDKMFSGTWPAFIEMIDGFVGRKETMIFKIVNKEPELGPREKVFLDLLAGSSSSSASRKRPASNQSDSAPPRVANEGEVDVGQDLLDMMQTEVEEACALLKSTAGQTFRPTTCPCCPWRRFDKRAHLIRHLQFQHVTSKRFCPSGTKQLRIAVSIYDQDALRGKVMEPNFLSRSAAIMRADVLPPIPTKYVFVDKTVRYVFIETGPIIMALHTIKSRSDLRRLGNLYYNRGFACLFLKAAATNNASLHRIYTDVIGSCTRHEGQLVSLVPRATNGFWTNVMEDLMQSPSLVSYREGLFTQCFENEEFDYISIDATFKINLKVIGQANFHSSQSSRDAAAIPESEAAYRTLTCRGRTGATLLVRVVRSEKASVVAQTLQEALPQHHRDQVRHLASDAPSVEMHRVLQGALPGLRSLSLDAMHIVMVYEQNMNNKKTSGSKWLAMIMDKFRKRDPKRSASSWGPVYEGQILPQPSASVRSMRARLETPDMSYLQAYNHLEQLKPNQPWLTELEFLHAVLAHLSMFHEETAKNTYSGATLHRLIVNVASPTKFQWLLNDTRYRHSVPRERLVLLPSGTTSNESLHHELNHWFRETVTRLQTIYVMCNSYTVVLGYSRRMLEGGDAQGHPDPETGILPVCQDLHTQSGPVSPLAKASWAV